MKRILIVEDELVIRTELARFLQHNGYEVSEAGSVAEAIEQEPSRFDLLLADIRLPGPPGTDLIALARGRPVCLMTSYATIRGAVGSMRMGAVDYLSKPFDFDELSATLARLLEGKPRRPAPSSSPDDFGMLGSSAAMVAVRERVRKVAKSEATVLVLGASGTGKELVARALHAKSPRASGPFVAVNCASIPEALIESELFGHQRGAFTGATSSHLGLVHAAEGGTLFLDEIGELPMSTQPRLLRFLQTGEVRAVGSSKTQLVRTRLVAATHRDLASMAREGSFRDDLYFRLRVLEIRMPTLAERPEDILELARAFVESAALRAGVPAPEISSDAERALLGHAWTGNIRELENAIERAIVFAEDGKIQPEHLALEQPPPSHPPASADLSLEDYFRRFVLENEAHMTETELARKLGMSRKTLWERRQKSGLLRRR